MSVQCVPPILFAPRISWTSVAPPSKNEPVLSMSVQSKSCVCVFFLSLERVRSHLCHVCSVCSSHLVCSTHLEDKRGALEQERTSPFHVGSVKVLCVFLSTLEQARIYLCPVGSMCSSHLVCFTQHRGQAWRPRARTNQSLPSRFSQSLVCVSFSPRASKILSVPCSFSVFLPSCLLHASRGQNVDPSSKHDPVFTMSVQSKSSEKRVG